ncbi:unnamed protein product [Oreochromis niloticus]|nr:unnamed protein product [Mustela putorius furo]
MQSLVVQALAMRQLGRLSPRHLLATGYGLRQTEWCPRTIHTRQLCGYSVFPVTPGCHRPAFRGRDALSKIEDAFYNNKLRLNGQKLIKKSKTVKLGDTLDLVLSENPETNTVTLMRVILRRVFTDTGNTEKHKVAIRRWKCLELPREEAFKP